MTFPYAALLFDLDGVLADTEALIGELWADIFAGHDLHLGPAEITRLTSGQTFEGVVEQLDQQRGWKAPEDFLPMLDGRFNAAFTHVPAIEGASETLQALRQAGVPIAVASNSARNRLHLKLSGAGLDGFFGEFTFDPSRVGGRGKPLPDLYQYAARALGVPVERCLVIEDSFPGASAGVAAGATVWGLLAGSHILPGDREKLLGAGAARVLNSHAELREALALA